MVTTPQDRILSDENFKLKHTLFCRELRFVAIYALFGDLWAKKVPFWVKNSVSWARIALFVGIANYTELNLQICSYAQKQRICRKQSKYALDESFDGHLPSPKGCQLLPPCLELFSLTLASSILTTMGILSLGSLPTTRLATSGATAPVLYGSTWRRSLSR